MSFRLLPNQNWWPWMA